MIVENRSANSESSNRVIPFEGIRNFRDMGGYKTTDGRRVKRGLFYRSAELTGITEKDLELFKTLGIKYIFDYRDENEAKLNPDPIIANVLNERIPAIEAEQLAPVLSIEELVKSEFFKQMNGNMLTDFYSKMAINNASYKRLMDIIQNADHLGLVHHCAAGKDRTGVGAALILLTLGVPKETVLEDYLITNETLKDFNEGIKMKVSNFLSAEDNKKFEGMMTAKEEYLEAVFKKIEQIYGGLDRYLLEEYNLTFDKREQLKSNCLE